MSWGRYLRLVVIVIAAGLLTLVEGLAQQRPVAEMALTNDNHQPATVDPAPRSLLERGPLVNIAKSSDEDGARPSQPPGEAEASAHKPIPIPEVLFLPRADQLSPLDQAYLDAFSILIQDNSCSRFYGGSRVITVLNQLKKQLKQTYMDSNVAVKMSGSTMSVMSLKYGFSYRLFDKAELNLRGSFYHDNSFRGNGTVPAIGSFSPNTREARATILLHELGHLVEKAHEVWLLPNDGKNELLSNKNTRQIVAVCGEQIRQLSRTSFETELQAARSTLVGPTVQASIQQ